MRAPQEHYTFFQLRKFEADDLWRENLRSRKLELSTGKYVLIPRPGLTKSFGQDSSGVESLMCVGAFEKWPRYEENASLQTLKNARDLQPVGVAIAANRTKVVRSFGMLGVFVSFRENLLKTFG